MCTRSRRRFAQQLLALTLVLQGFVLGCTCNQLRFASIEAPTDLRVVARTWAPLPYTLTTWPVPLRYETTRSEYRLEVWTQKPNFEVRPYFEVHVSDLDGAPLEIQGPAGCENPDPSCRPTRWREAGRSRSSAMAR